jgi:alginate O-acetyltransferase complex protein AlgI
MLFNSHEFLFLFLPATLAGYWWLNGHAAPRIALGWLVAASLVFYGWWNPVYLWVLIVSMAGNYAFGRAIAACRPNGAAGAVLVAVGVAANLALLGYFKYSGFLLDNLTALAGQGWSPAQIILPLGISFFTFQQIAYLADCRTLGAAERDFVKYGLFVSFFPQLIAGPIVHHGEMLPQFEREETYHLRASNLAAGLAFFTIGLFKKVVIADGVAPIASLVFDAAAEGRALTTFDAWAGALAYTAQLYFDFSGYSDMAIGLGRLFGIRLPVNFNSPYKAVNIIEFWRRWHMTLSRFLRDYLYIPLGGNRRGRPRRYLNLMITMLLGGLWHGAAWTFVVWGAVHGLLLCVGTLPRAGLRLGLVDPGRDERGRRSLARLERVARHGRRRAAGGRGPRDRAVRAQQQRDHGGRRGTAGLGARAGPREPPAVAAHRPVGARRGHRLHRVGGLPEPGQRVPLLPVLSRRGAARI